MAAKSTEVATVEPSEMMEFDESTFAEMEEVLGAGVSDNIDDRGTPLLYIAQGQSKFVKKQRPEYIPGLEVGMAFNNITGKFWDTENNPLALVPCFFRANWLEWTPQNDGGGYHGSHPRNTPLLKTSDPVEGRSDIRKLDNGHELVLTHHYFCLIEETMQPIVVPMSSSNLGASSKLQTLLSEQKVKLPNGKIATLPAFYTRLNLSTVFTSNDKGDFYVYVPRLGGRIEDPVLLQMGKEFALAVKNSEVDIAEPIQSQAAEDEIPF